MRLPHSIFISRRKILKIYDVFLQVNLKQFHSSLSKRLTLQDGEVDKHHNKRAKSDFTLKNSQINSEEKGETDVSKSPSILLGRCNSDGIGMEFDVEKIITSLQDGDRKNALVLLQNGSLYLRNFASILRSCSKLHDPMFALKTWNVMVERGIIPDTVCYRSVIQALCDGGYFEEAFSFLQCPGEGLPICASLAVYNELLNECFKIRNWAYAHQCLMLMEEKKVGKNQKTYMLLLRMAAYNNLISVKKVWEEYNRQFSCSIVALQGFVTAFALVGDVKSAYGKLQRMIELSIRAIRQKDVSSKLDIPIPLKVHMVKDVEVDVCSDEKHSYLDFGNAKIFGEEKRKVILKFKRAFEDVMRACNIAKDYMLTERLMAQMQDLGLQPTAEIYHNYLSALLKQNKFDEALEIFKLMKSRNIHPSSMSLVILAMGCSENNEPDLAEKFVEQVSNLPGTYYVNQFLTACQRMYLRGRGLQVFRQMREKIVRPDIRTYELLVSLYLNVSAPYRRGTTDSQLECLKRWKVIEMDMTLNTVGRNHWFMMYLVKAFADECLVNEVRFYLPKALELFGLIENNDEAVLVYTVVIHALINIRELDSAIETYENMLANGYKPDGVLYSLLIYLCRLIGCHKSALALVSLIIRDGHQNVPDFYKSLFTFVDLEEALCITNKMTDENMKPSVNIYNDLLRLAVKERNVQTMEHLLEKMKRSEIKPNVRSCAIVFCAYCKHGFYYTAFEALQVLCFRMIGLGDTIQSDEFFQFARDYVFEEDTDLERDFVTHYDDDEAFTLLMLRWTAVSGFPVCWAPEDSLWASRTSSSYQFFRNIPASFFTSQIK